ncbi:hypothetical protein SAMN05421690_10885 [Nitrosomonas sp. Nm51]|uniref:hypothetical protein n=1 Tax=Nitrosomonas sp. Nm51 TaxID=133720 RepID=UPI0008BFC067|nr:hypothetical protein [Nitrosomonas sp. Nm51]SER81818.1 hypothetical protein SAMN05421690_10885 [Nitrosomonas sp. Nm51]
MSDSKTKPKNPKYSVSDEIHKAAYEATVAQEESDKAMMRLEMMGWDFEDAMVVIFDENCPPREVVKLAEQGKTKDEIIDALKKMMGKWSFHHHKQ